MPKQLSPRERAARLLAEPQYVHADTCRWTGDDAKHPCTCAAPDLLRAVAATIDLERLFDYGGDVLPDQPEPLPDVHASITPPDRADIDSWTLAWTAVRFRTCGAWKIGVVKGKIQLTDGTWILEIEHAHDGLHSGWADKVFIAWDPLIIRPIEAEPPTVEPDR